MPLPRRPIPGRPAAHPHPHPHPHLRRPQGFTLIELMITVAVIAILARVAYPVYINYALRGAVQEGLQGLAASRLKMEQYFMDNRSYVSTGTTCGTGIGSGLTLQSPSGKFAITCTGTASTYTVTATGSGSVNGFVYTINQDNARSSTISRSGWGSGSTLACWIDRPGAGC